MEAQFHEVESRRAEIEGEYVGKMWYGVSMWWGKRAWGRRNRRENGRARMAGRERECLDALMIHRTSLLNQLFYFNHINEAFNLTACFTSLSVCGPSMLCSLTSLNTYIYVNKYFSPHRPIFRSFPAFQTFNRTSLIQLNELQQIKTRLKPFWQIFNRLDQKCCHNIKKKTFTHFKDC